MKRKPSLAQMFRYCPGAINLTGYEYSPVLLSIASYLGQEVSLKQHRISPNGRPLVLPSFPLKYVEDRQRFFKTLPDETIARNIFSRYFPKTSDCGKSAVSFSNFCEQVYFTRQGLIENISYFEHLHQSRTILRRLGKFDKDLTARLEGLAALNKQTRFIFDTSSGEIFPARCENGYYSSPNESDDNIPLNLDYVSILDKIRIRMKNVVTELAKGGRKEFRRKIMQFVHEEFDFSPDSENVRSCLELLAFPSRLHNRYEHFLNRVNALTDKKDVLEERGLFDMPDIPQPIYPIFGDNYDINGLFPPKLFPESLWDFEGYVPIDFKTKPGENKFLIAGLHSGGKSFFLDNIVLLPIVNQLGECLPANSLISPLYKRIFYHRAVKNSGNDDGKLLRDMKELDEIIEEVGEGDLLVLDEFLDSTTPAIATWLGPELLKNRLGKKNATIFVSTHRNHDYRELSRNGWTIMSPGYKIERGKVVPTHRLERGIPNEKINRRFVQERYSEMVCRKR